MVIKKKYKFYASHRNQLLCGKCSSWHGHRYGITIAIIPEKSTAGITMLFADVDAIADKVIEEYDHACLIDKDDPYFEQMTSMVDGDQLPMKYKVFEEPTSVENLAGKLFHELFIAGLPMSEIEVQETDTSVVIYTALDYEGELQ
jgi:6-pyruvoyl-tetrahydropterin synthase